MPYNILLIDDSITQLEILSKYFKNAGLEVTTAKDGYEGYKKIFECLPDLILSDVMMPNLNGFQLCRLIKNNPETKKIPVILLTALDKKIDKFWASKSGAEKFISKATNPNEIISSAMQVIERNSVPEDYKNALLQNPIEKATIQNQVNDIFDELLMSSTILNEFRDLGEFVNQEIVLVEKTFDLLSSFIDYNICGLFLSNQDKNEKNVLYLDINKNCVSNFVLEKIKRDFFAEFPSLSNFTIRDFGHEIIKEHIENENAIINPNTFKTKHILPLYYDETLIGGICFYNTEDVNYQKSKFYKTMLKELILLLRMRCLYAEKEYISVTDGLTGLYNRRHFEVNIEREFLRTRRYQGDLSIAMIDIDHFKQINDTYGHQFGDYVLKEISKIFLASFRKTDMIYRYGGEEIVVILTETPLEGALIPLERLKDKIAQTPFIYNGTQTNVTISIGVSYKFEELASHKELVGAADKALYKAKQTGRNRVVAFTHDELSKISD